SGGRGGGWAGNQDWRSQNSRNSYGGESSSSNDWNSNGRWREQERRALDRAPNRQHQRGDDIANKTVKGSLIATHRGLVIQKFESECYQEGDWLVFDKTAKSDMTLEYERKGRETFPPYILQHKKMENGYGGETRMKGKKEGWNIQARGPDNIQRLR
ncbi:hypothetical protein PENTCL1PPCAC_9559, partial [Pristionchus entomophagus]